MVEAHKVGSTVEILGSVAENQVLEHEQVNLHQ